MYEYYNVAADDYVSIGMSEITLSAPNAKGAWHVGPAASGLDSPYHGMKSGEYLIPVDQSWADANTGGKSLLVGRYREAGCCGGSMGPVLLAIAPWLDGNPLANGSNLSASPLMYFNSITIHTDDTTWMRWRFVNDPDYTYYSAGDNWHGGAWISQGSKKAIVMGCRHGTLDMVKVTCPAAGSDGCHGGVGTTTPPFCYGTGGIECPYNPPIANTNDKGYHTGPYKPRLVFIDPDDLAAAAQGKKNAWEVTSYDTYDPTPDWPWNTTANRNNIWQGNGGIGGVAYDSTNGILYVAQGNGYCPGCADDVNAAGYPLIQVYRVGSRAGVKARAAKVQTGFSVKVVRASCNHQTTAFWIRFEGAACTQLNVYGIHGALVKTFAIHSAAPLEWDAAGQPSGLYLLVAKSGHSTVCKQIPVMN